MSLTINDTGIILSVKKYSENSLIVKILSNEHGIYGGFVKGGLSSKKTNSTYQVGNLVDFTWKAKVEDNLGFFKIELSKSYLSKIIFNNLKLHCVSAILGVIQENILEREPHNELFLALHEFLDNIDVEEQIFLSNYVRLEFSILQILGYGIDINSCALTGKTTDLYFISPKSGRAACKEAGMKYKDKLLRLPNFISSNNTQTTKDDIFNGLKLTHHFLKKHLANENSKFFEARAKIDNIIASGNLKA